MLALPQPAVGALQLTWKGNHKGPAVRASVSATTAAGGAMAGAAWGC
jgi:hypothetical protein